MDETSECNPAVVPSRRRASKKAVSLPRCSAFGWEQGGRVIEAQALRLASWSWRRWNRTCRLFHLAGPDKVSRLGSEMAEVDAREAQRRDRSSPQAQKHLSSSIPHPLPLFDHDRNLLADVLHDAIHLDVIPIEPERVLELAGDAVDAVEGEGH